MRSKTHSLFENINYLFGSIFVFLAALFPITEGPLKDVFQQLFYLGALFASILFFGLSATSTVIPLTAIFFALLMQRAVYFESQIVGIFGLIIAVFGCMVGAHFRLKSAGIIYLLFAITAAAIINAAEGLLQWLGLVSALSPWVIESSPGTAYGTFRQPNLFATFLCVGVVTSVWLVQLKRMTASMAWFLLCLLSFAIVASGSRTGLIELFAIAVMGFTLRKDQPVEITQLMIGQLILCSIAMVLLPIAADLHGFNFGSGATKVVHTFQDGRLIIWSNALILIAEHPWIGWGWNEFGYAHFATLFKHKFNGEILDNAHNLPLQIAVEFGVPVAALTISGIAYIFWTLRPWKKHKDKLLSPKEYLSMKYSWIIFMLIFFIHSMLEYPLWSIFFLYILSIFFGHLISFKDSLFFYNIKNTYQILFCKIISLSMILFSIIGWQQYSKLQIISTIKFNSTIPRDLIMTHADNSWFFTRYLDFLKLTIIEKNSFDNDKIADLSKKQLHHIANPIVIETLLSSLCTANKKMEWEFYARRYHQGFPDQFKKWQNLQSTDDVNLDNLYHQCSK